METKYVLNNSIVVPVNLRYTDGNGDLVTALYPYEYLVLVGQTLNSNINDYDALNVVVSGHTTQIASLNNAVQNIPPEYNTPEINGYCLNNNTTQPIDEILALLVTAWCSYNLLIGNNGAISGVITSQCANLASDTSFAGGTMSSIAGWVATPTTLSDSLKNLWRTMCDARTGIKELYTYLRPGCAQITIDYQAIVASYEGGIKIYFSGYSFIPEAYTSSGSTIVITDSAGNISSTSFNIVSAASTNTPITIAIQGSSLLPTSNYTVTVNSILTDGTNQCSKSTIKTITNNISSCPVINATSTQTTVSFYLTPFITTSVIYRVDLYTLAGTSVIATVSFTNPASIQANTFTSLTASTAYRLIVTTTVTGSAPVQCAQTNISTI